MKSALQIVDRRANRQPYYRALANVLTEHLVSGSWDSGVADKSGRRPGQMRDQVRQETLRLLRPVTVAADLVQSTDDLSEAHLIDRIAVHTEIAARQHPQIAGR